MPILKKGESLYNKRPKGNQPYQFITVCSVTVHTICYRAYACQPESNSFICQSGESIPINIHENRAYLYIVIYIWQSTPHLTQPSFSIPAIGRWALRPGSLPPRPTVDTMGPMVGWCRPPGDLDLCDVPSPVLSPAWCEMEGPGWEVPARDSGSLASGFCSVGGSTLTRLLPRVSGKQQVWYI